MPANGRRPAAISGTACYSPNGALTPVPQGRKDFRRGDKLLFVRGRRMIVGSGEIIDFDKANSGRAVFRIVDMGSGPRPEDEAYIISRTDTPYSIVNLSLTLRDS